MRRKCHPLLILIILLYTAVMLAPIGWMLVTSFKKSADTPAIPPSILPTFAQSAPPAGWFRFSLENYADQFSTKNFGRYVFNSVFIAGVTTLVSAFLGAFAAYGFSRFKMPGSKDWQFFILSTRMLPAMAVSVPISWMYHHLGLNDTHFGLILLYTCFNLSFSTWMMKAFIDEIPTAYEEAALLDGYTRWQVFFKLILPQAMTGLLATSVFCLIASWNEYAFAMTLTTNVAVTLPVHLAAVSSEPGTPYGKMAAGAVMFMTPIVIFSIVMRKHLLRGVTFGAVKG